MIVGRPYAPRVVRLERTGQGLLIVDLEPAIHAHSTSFPDAPDEPPLAFSARPAAPPQLLDAGSVDDEGCLAFDPADRPRINFGPDVAALDEAS